MRSLPSGCRSNQTVSPIPYAIATPAQTSANRTAWSLKKLPTISVPTPSQGQRRGVPGAGRFLSHAARRRPARPEGARRARGARASRPDSDGWCPRGPPPRPAAPARPPLPGPPRTRTPRRLPSRRQDGLRAFALPFRSVRVGELEVRRDLLEVADDLLTDGALEHRDERTERLDRELRLVEVAVVLG